MTLIEIIAALEAIDPKNGADRLTMEKLDAEITLIQYKAWRGVTLELGRVCDSDKGARDMDSTGWIGWCVLVRDGDSVYFSRAQSYTSNIAVARSLWKYPIPDMIPSYPIPCCIAALKARLES